MRLRRGLWGKEQTPDGKTRAQRGASLVEAALVTPLFFMAIFAVFELTIMGHNYLRTTGATTASTRAATVAGTDIGADYLALRALEHGMPDNLVDDIELVVIYKADGPGADVPVGCLSTPVPAGLSCNSYTKADFFLNYADALGNLTGHWGCGPTARDDAWCPSSRQSGLSDPGGPDHIGIYVRVKQRNLTGMFNWDRSLEVNRISRVEPSRN